MKRAGKADTPETPAAAAPETGRETAAHSIIATVALRTGNALLKQSLERGILGRAPGVVKAAATAAAGIKLPKAERPKRSLATKLAMAAATRIATRSVPGAIVVGGALLAKTLYDRKRSKKP
jgi:hypothetical protein